MTGASFAWLETLLDLLFERFDLDGAKALLRDAAQRGRVLRQLTPEVIAAGAPTDVFDTSQGENMFMAVLALRLKFPRDEAREKVRRNIAMRGEPDRGSGR